MICDWCESPMTDIGPETTCMEAAAGWHVWLCDKPGCGHERSGKRTAIQPAPTLTVDDNHSIRVESAKWCKRPMRSYALHFQTPAAYYVLLSSGASRQHMLYSARHWD